jgi:hypothetical protein
MTRLVQRINRKPKSICKRDIVWGVIFLMATNKKIAVSWDVIARACLSTKLYCVTSQKAAILKVIVNQCSCNRGVSPAYCWRCLIMFCLLSLVVFLHLAPRADSRGLYYVIHPFIHRWLYNPMLGHGLFFNFIIFLTQTFGLLGRVISPSQGRYLHTEQHDHRINAHTDIHAFFYFVSEAIGLGVKCAGA